MFLNYIIVVPVFQLFTFKLLHNKEFVLSSISLLILPISFFAGFIS